MTWLLQKAIITFSKLSLKQIYYHVCIQRYMYRPGKAITTHDWKATCISEAKLSQRMNGKLHVSPKQSYLHARVKSYMYRPMKAIATHK